MDQLNTAILVGLAQWRSPLLNKAVLDISSLGSVTVVSMVTAAACLLLWTIARDRVGVAKLVTSVAGAEIGVEILKRIVQEPRPTAVPYLTEFTGFSFPSGHALVAAATYGMLASVFCGYVQQASG